MDLSIFDYHSSRFLSALDPYMEQTIMPAISPEQLAITTGYVLYSYRS
jgi:hypothetical protein